jgi:hypothetical protein
MVDELSRHSAPSRLMGNGKTLQVRADTDPTNDCEADW